MGYPMSEIIGGCIAFGRIFMVGLLGMFFVGFVH